MIEVWSKIFIQKHWINVVKKACSAFFYVIVMIILFMDWDSHRKHQNIIRIANISHKLPTTNCKCAIRFNHKTQAEMCRVPKNVQPKFIQYKHTMPIFFSLVKKSSANDWWFVHRTLWPFDLCHLSKYCFYVI